MISIADPNIKSGITLFDNVFKDIDFSFFGGTDKVEKLKNLILFDKSCIKRRQEVFSDILENEGLIAFFDKLCEKLDAIDDMASSRKNAALYSSNEGLLYSFRELGVYTECIETIINAGEIFKEKVKSEWLIELFEYATKIKNETWYKNTSKFLSETDEKIRDIKSITLGINLDAELRPKEAGIVSINDKPYVANTILDKLFSEKAESKEYVAVSVLCKNEFGIDARQMNSLTGQVYSALNSMFSKTLVKIKGVLQKAEWENALLNIISEEIRFVKNGADYILSMKAKGLPVCMPDFSDGDEFICDLYYPGLSLYTKTADIVKNDAAFDENGRIFILTGQNSGGKSVFLRAVGVCYVLFQLGLPIPAKSAKMRLVDGFFTHFITKANMTVGGRLENECRSISEICKKMTSDSLLLMDESFSSTGSKDGAIIAEEVLDFMSKKGCRCIYATHMHELLDKIEIISDEKSASRIDLLSVDPQNKYKIERKRGDGASHALEIFKKYGLELKS